MDPARWSRLETISNAALERRPEDRDAFLHEACATDPELRREVERLLASLDADPEFLEVPLVKLRDAEVAEGRADARFIGPYRLVRPLGHGGMGEVFLARRDVGGVEQAVAVKVLRRGMDSDEVIRRFRQERQILASLHHPNIAHLTDGGVTEDGRPFFVMEYVDGEPIDRYCERRRLSVSERLGLFTVVCSAVQHAHRNLVVHRDIKPSNILVTGDGVAKLLDFGIGKVIEESAGAGNGVDTRTEVRVLTPEYAAPEQVRGERITTATDVHGLGVLLYVILTGRHPFATGERTREDVQRAVCDEEAPRPSRIERRLAGDLDTIVLKALRKEPERRYASPDALVDDIERHLEGRPVAARPDTLAYRAGKFIRRNPWGVAAGAITVVALTGVSVITSLQSRQAARERDAALEVRGFLLESFGARGPTQSQEEPVAARALLDQQAATLAYAYADRPALRAEMLQVVAEGYERLGLYDVAEQRAREALALRREFPSDDPADAAWPLALIGWIRNQQAKPTEADSILREAVALFRTAGTGGRRGLARALNDLGVVLQERGNFVEAEAALAEALDIRTRHFVHDARATAITANNLAGLHYRRGDLPQAVALGERALASLRQALGPDHQRAAIEQRKL
jgi:serine/threonine-protein kinase